MNKALETLEKVITDQQTLIELLIKTNMDAKNESTMVLTRIMDGFANVWGQMLTDQLKGKQEGKVNIDDNTGHVDFPRSGPT